MWICLILIIVVVNTKYFDDYVNLSDMNFIRVQADKLLSMSPFKIYKKEISFKFWII